MLKKGQILYIAKHLIRMPKNYTWMHFLPPPRERCFDEPHLRRYINDFTDSQYGHIYFSDANKAIAYAKLHAKMQAYKQCSKYKEKGKKFSDDYISSKSDLDITLLYEVKVTDVNHLKSLNFNQNVTMNQFNAELQEKSNDVYDELFAQLKDTESYTKWASLTPHLVTVMGYHLINGEQEQERRYIRAKIPLHEECENATENDAKDIVDDNAPLL